MSITAEEVETLAEESRAVEGEHITADEAKAAGLGGDASEAEPQPSMTGKVIGDLLKPTFANLAPLWNVTDTECDMLGQAYGAVLDKYFPGGMGVEATAVIVTLAVFAPRWGKPARSTEETPPADD